MGQLKALIPAAKTSGSSRAGVNVSGTILKMDKATVAKIGATSTVQFQLGTDQNDIENRLYIRTGVPDVAEFKLLGKEGNSRYVNDAGLVQAAKLQNQGYQLMYDADLKAHYITFNPDAEWTAPVAKARKPRTPEQIARAKEKYEAKKAAKAAAGGGKTSVASKASATNRPRG